MLQVEGKDKIKSCNHPTPKVHTSRDTFKNGWGVRVKIETYILRTSSPYSLALERVVFFIYFFAGTRWHVHVYVHLQYAYIYCHTSMRALPSTFTSITWTEAQYVYAVTYTNYSQPSSHMIEEKDALQTSVPNSSWSHRWYIDCMSNGSYQLLDPRGNTGIALTPLHACVCAILCNLALLNEHIKYRCTGVQMPKATACKRYFMRVGRQKGSQHGDVGPIFWGSITQAVC